MTALAADPATIAMLLADARLPSGGHAHSSGLEPALLGGMPASEAAAFLRARARTTTLVDAGTAVAARHAALVGAPLAAVEDAWTARTPSRAMREASRDLGRGLRRLAERIWPDSAAITALGVASSPPPRPLVLGAIAAETGLEPEQLVRLAVYDDLAGAVAALLKLDPRDPADGVALVLSSCASIEARIPTISAVRHPEDIPSLSAPQAEAWAESHATARGRLFRG
ncbi:urease accessory protein UreF [Protaetiibacter larvae]|uniref:Urease accessory protein n=1 Tax=Protaetiibacter larvae TaxID=2592654 RepID=A0A5C1Y5C6_9MICO|nr:urease accessory UreF family protein [Protaetiibacter larvae]QEO08910.1 urease accessory protein [Protaetiibacter larvae]